jgi:hypothetical protein
MKNITTERIASLVALICLALMLGAPTLVLSMFVGLTGWEGFLLGAITGVCNMLFVLSIFFFFKLEDSE